MNRLRAGISLCNVTFYWVNGSGGGGGWQGYRIERKIKNASCLFSTRHSSPWSSSEQTSPRRQLSKDRHLPRRLAPEVLPA